MDVPPPGLFLGIILRDAEALNGAKLLALLNFMISTKDINAVMYCHHGRRNTRPNSFVPLEFNDPPGLVCRIDDDNVSLGFF